MLSQTLRSHPATHPVSFPPVLWGTVVWWSASAAPCYSALRQLTRSTLFLCVPSCIAAALLYNDQLRIGAVWRCVVGDICSSPPAKSPHHMVLFMCRLFHIERGTKKRTQTHKLCPNDNKGNAITGNTFTTSPALSPQWLGCM